MPEVYAFQVMSDYLVENGSILWQPLTVNDWMDSPHCVRNILYLEGSVEILNWIQSQLEQDACWEIRGGHCGW